MRIRKYMLKNYSEFVGADLENLLNEAAILAARKNSDTITMAELDEAVDRIGLGLRKQVKSQNLRKKIACVS